MPTLTLDNLKNDTGGASTPQVEWQRYALDSATFGTQTLTLDDIHGLMVGALQRFRMTIPNLGVQPQNDVSLGRGVSGWATLALKNLPNTTTQNQWANTWRVKLLPQSTTNPTGEFFSVHANAGYVELGQVTHPQAVNYANLYSAAGGTNEVASRLISLFQNPATDNLPSDPGRKTAVRQIATALFLAEVHRNHLTLLVNLAMLDLLKAGVFDLNYFVGNFHPMAQGGPMDHIGQGTSGAENGGTANTRTRILETTILMYWLKLHERFVVLKKGNDPIEFKPNQQALSAIRQVPGFDHALCTLRERGMLESAIQERMLKALLKSDLKYKT